MTTPMMLRRDVLKETFRLLERTRRDLAYALKSLCDFFDVSPTISVEDLFTYLRLATSNDVIRIWFGSMLAHLDYASSGDWAAGTRRSTRARRQAIYNGLGLTEAQQEYCEQAHPYYPAVDDPIVITAAKDWHRWYTPERRSEQEFYWPAYRAYLAEVTGWNGKNLSVLDETTTDVVERLADPSSPSNYQSKGLVVGYVQSGKTAHYTGVIAKAADAGYRLIIVLAGTINILREQTQRRLDKELLGWELVHDDYVGDPEERYFLHHGGFPSANGAFDWERLTLAKEDFQRLRVGISALEFRRVDPRRPLFDSVNLRPEKARLIVVKKTAQVLDKLIDSIRRAASRTDFGSVPTLIIDDESDQASVNTKKPTPNEIRKRTAINGSIVALMQLLGRAQYVGYTATPFANVFIDPDDASDLYPSDFIVALPKPDGYMGVADFYDHEEPVDGDYSFNRNAYVRFVEGEDSEARNLPSAIDSYVLAGAIKLFRHDHGEREYRHHTMLVHHSAFTGVHSNQASRVIQMYREANYLGGGPGLRRLQAMWESDFGPISRVRVADKLPIPPSFESLRAYIGDCCRRINEGERPVLIVNGDNKDEAPNFEKNPVWKIIIGGTKLSRGYTLEGLTISYYRRTASAADTLMQMGRWFGYRAGYQDLVRLYIGKREQLDRKGKKFINLYDAFYGICRDEEEFRSELARYSKLEGDERVTPKQIPPLVPSHMLRPTATNKMYNAVLAFENFGEKWVERTMAPLKKEDTLYNQEQMRRLLKRADLRHATLKFDLLDDDTQAHLEFAAIAGHVSSAEVIMFLQQYRWQPSHQNTLKRVLEFLSGDHGDPEIDRWLLVAPQTKSIDLHWDVNEFEFAERIRSRIRERYGVYSEPAHVDAARFFAGIRHGRALTPTTEALSSSKQAVLVFYPVRSEEERRDRFPVTMGFGLQFPANRIPRRVRYEVHRKEVPDAVTVEKG